MGPPRQWARDRGHHELRHRAARRHRVRRAARGGEGGGRGQALRRRRGGQDRERPLRPGLRPGGRGEHGAFRQPRAREPATLRRGVDDPPPAPRSVRALPAALEPGLREAGPGAARVSFVGLSPDEERRMLETIGVGSFEELLSALPRKVRLKQPLAVEGPLSEIELRRRFAARASENAAERAVSFLGGGIYDHYIPSALNALAMRSEFATAYTPYQPEVAQGTLTAIFEFQSLIAELTGCEVANASLYDGATAAVEAVLMSRTHTGRKRVVAAGAIQPHVLH